MEGYSSFDSNISLDSLETEFKKKSTMKKKVSEEEVDTILVPFYEKDVLIKVPKGQKSKNNNKNINENSNSRNANNKCKKETPPTKNYLVNKDSRKKKHTSYLEMFRKQFAPIQTDIKQTENDVRSVSPEFGDTERESFREQVSNPNTDFFNTEAYNEIYYDKLMNQELNNFLERAYENEVKFTTEIRTNSPENHDENNLRSISEVSQTRRNMRRKVPPIPSIKLGGLGPDMENIRPRLERARSLQRYSEKVRMENRVRIYKKSVQEEIEKKADKDLSSRRQDSAKSRELKGNENSFLVNKNASDRVSQMNKRTNSKSESKSKCANTKQTKHTNAVNDKSSIKDDCKNQNNENDKAVKKSTGTKVFNKERSKSSDLKRNNLEPAKIQSPVDVPIPPVHISFLVNVGGLRPSSALRTLEAKHRMYQEKVKAFAMNDNNEDKGDNNK